MVICAEGIFIGRIRMTIDYDRWCRARGSIFMTTFNCLAAAANLSVMLSFPIVRELRDQYL